jgi:hypothetical protein
MSISLAEIGVTVAVVRTTISPLIVVVIVVIVGARRTAVSAARSNYICRTPYRKEYK